MYIYIERDFKLSICTTLFGQNSDALYCIYTEIFDDICINSAHCKDCTTYNLVMSPIDKFHQLYNMLYKSMV